MFAWFIERLPLATVRLVVTLASCVTLQRIIVGEGYRCKLSTVIVGAILMILTMRLWMPRQHDRDTYDPDDV